MATLNSFWNRMRRTTGVLATGVALLSLPASADAPTEIKVPISQVRSSQGVVFVALYQQSNWLVPGRYYRAQKVTAHQGTVYASFQGVPRGRYGIAVFHDENANGRVDTNVVGLPREGFGFSLKTPFRKPSFGEVSFDVQPSAIAPTRLRY
jgi:uncharacterized protein (DUF2141 family)